MSGFLIDTNVVSQLTKSEPHVGAYAWLETANRDDVYLSVISIEEIREGIERMPGGRKRQQLEVWFSEELLVGYADRILPVTIDIADRCGCILGSEELRRFQIDVSDAYLAATAQVHRLVVATLNWKDFARLGVEMVEF